MIRLLNTTSLEFELFADSGAVSYVILSHRWRDEEVRFEEMKLPDVSKKKGYQKILACCKLALSANIRFVWVDTCCIDKRSSAELSEAINSMYRWYEDSTECYAYLDDVKSEEDVRQSEWFSRCWTLQELIAPKKVTFFKQNWQAFGTKRSLRYEITEATKIPLQVLKGGRIFSYSAAQRMSWASKRKCTQIEDEAYSLLGLFEVNMPLIYGERRNAFIRLQEEIIKRSEDQSIFAWSSTDSGYRGMLALSPEYFSDSSDVCEAQPPIMRRWDLGTEHRPCEMTSRGLHISLDLFSTPVAMDTYIAQLNCTRQDQPDDRLGIYLCQVEQLAGGNTFARAIANGQDVVNVRKEERIMIGNPRSLYVLQNERKLRTVRVKKLGFAISSHISYTCHNQNHVNQEANFVEKPEDATGHVVTLRVTEPDSKLGAVVLGFDTNFLPTCTLFDRDATTTLSDSLQRHNLKWIGEKMQQSQKGGSSDAVENRAHTWGLVFQRASEENQLVRNLV